jgi:hypothetical protein
MPLVRAVGAKASPSEVVGGIDRDADANHNPLSMTSVVAPVADGHIAPSIRRSARTDLVTAGRN